MKKILINHFSISLALFLFMNLGLGYRHIWQDEVETAERARSILSYGVPKTIDREGRISINTSGSELENSDLHRYTPWGQFYAGAIGLATGKVLNLSPDRSIRLPFIASHALTSGLISYGLTAFGGLPVISANIVATVFGLQTIRVVHNRTARYHALLDLLLTLGLIGLGLLLSSKKIGWVFVTTSIFLLPQVQPLSGSLYSLMIGLMGLYVLAKDQLLASKEKLTGGLLYIVLPGIVTLVLYILLSQIWIDRGFGGFSIKNGFRGIKSFVEISYSILMYLILSRLVFKNDKRSTAKLMWASLAIIILVVRGLDLHNFSQTRYYLSIVIFFLFAPLFFGWRPKQLSNKYILTFLLIGCLLPEITFWRRFATPFHGVHLVISDFIYETKGQQQPLHELITYIKKNRLPNESIAADYVPQFINWYIPNAPIALAPIIDGKTPANSERLSWDSEYKLPTWHFWYPSFGSGNWNCLNHCDYTVKDRDLVPGDRYQIKIERLDITHNMCVVKTWNTNQWINSPFKMYKTEALSPSGQTGLLVLAKKCP